MTTSYVVVACVSDKRWFDLDAERTTAQQPEPAGDRSDRRTRVALAADGRGDPGHHGAHPAGAPPLDCWIDGEPWTLQPSDEPNPMSRCRMMIGDAFDKMAALEDHSVDLIVTSPPFLALRSYLPADHPDKHLEIGSEPTPATYLTTLLALTREWRRILAPHGSICVELGDTYSGTALGFQPEHASDGYDTTGRQRAEQSNRPAKLGPGWPLAKSLCGIPTLYAWSLAYGHNLLNPDDTIEPWRIKNLIVWHRPNPPVGALGDKVRPSTSYITVACTSDKRWFDLDAERDQRLAPSVQAPSPKALAAEALGHHGKGMPATGDWHANGGAPPLDCWIDGDVWTIPTHPYKGAHYATYPPALPRRLIRLMCPRQVCVVCGEPRRRITGEAEYVSTNGGRVVNQWAGERRGDAVNQWTVQGGNPGHAVRSAPTLGWTDCGHDNYRRGHVLDPFTGTGTTLIAAAEQGRDATGIDIDPRNENLIRDRCGLFLEDVT